MLLDEWEPGLQWATLGPMLTRLREAVGPLLDGAIDRSGPAARKVPTRPVDVRLQAEVAREVAEWLGFDFSVRPARRGGASVDDPRRPG